MTIETTYILKADEGKILRNKQTGDTTSSVWLRIDDSKDDWEEIDYVEPEPEIEPISVIDTINPALIEDGNH